MDKPLRIQLIEADVAVWPEHMRLFYDLMVQCGNTEVMAHLLASRQAPMMGQSDRSFCESLHRSMSSMTQAQRSEMVEIARRNGINPDGKFYVGGFGRYGDPQAWCSTIEDARTTLKNNPHLNATGLVSQKAASPVGEPKGVRLADDLAQEAIVSELAENPSLAEKVKKGDVGVGELREMVEDKYAYKQPAPAVLRPSYRQVLDGLNKRAKQRRENKSTKS